MDEEFGSFKWVKVKQKSCPLQEFHWATQRLTPCVLLPPKPRRIFYSNKLCTELKILASLLTSIREFSVSLVFSFRYLQQIIFKIRKVSHWNCFLISGMTLLKKCDFPDFKFTLYFMGYENPADVCGRTEFTWFFFQNKLLRIRFHDNFWILTNRFQLMRNSEWNGLLAERPPLNWPITGAQNQTRTLKLITTVRKKWLKKENILRGKNI